MKQITAVIILSLSLFPAFSEDVEVTHSYVFNCLKSHFRESSNLEMIHVKGADIFLMKGKGGFHYFDAESSGFYQSTAHEQPLGPGMAIYMTVGQGYRKFNVKFESKKGKVVASTREAIPISTAAPRINTPKAKYQAKSKAIKALEEKLGDDPRQLCGRLAFSHDKRFETPDTTPMVHSNQ